MNIKISPVSRWLFLAFVFAATLGHAGGARADEHKPSTAASPSEREVRRAQSLIEQEAVTRYTAGKVLEKEHVAALVAMGVWNELAPHTQSAPKGDHPPTQAQVTAARKAGLITGVIPEPAGSAAEARPRATFSRMITRGARPASFRIRRRSAPEPKPGPARAVVRPGVTRRSLPR